MRLGGELAERRRQDLAAIGVVEVGRERADGAPVEVEAAVRIAARGEEEQGAADGAVPLLDVEVNFGARNRREDDDPDREAVVAALGKGALEVGEPRRRHGAAAYSWSRSDGRVERPSAEHAPWAPASERGGLFAV